MAAKKTSKRAKSKVGKVMHEYKHGELHTGSKKGPKVKNRKQAVAIALSEARRSGASVPPKKKSSGKRASAKKSSGSKKTSSSRKSSSSRRSTKKS